MKKDVKKELATLRKYSEKSNYAVNTVKNKFIAFFVFDKEELLNILKNTFNILGKHWYYWNLKCFIKNSKI